MTVCASEWDPVAVGGATLSEMVFAGGGSMLDGMTGDELDAAALRGRAESIAALLVARAIGRGDVVGLLAPNSPQWAAVALGAMHCGAAVTPLSPLATESELERQLADCDASIVFAAPGLADRVTGVEVLPIGSDFDAGGATTTGGADPAAVAFIPYSSGTTGLPKGVLLTHANLVTSIRQANAGLRMTDRDCVLAVAPFFHVMGFMLTLAVPLSGGARCVTMPRFDPAEFFGLIERHRVTCLVVPPPVMPLIAASDADLSSVEVVACGGAALPADVQRALEARLPQAAVGQGWGLTESTVGISIPDRAAGGSRPGSVGRLAPNTELRVVDPESGVDRGIGETGELWARGPQMMAGYLGNDAATRAMLDADGWLRTGDLGRVEAGGDVFVVGRLKELIKVNAFQVAPAELEAILLGHPAVADAAVVGRPDEACGEVPVAFVVARGDADEEELLSWVAERVARYKRLRAITFTDAIPRTPSGKVLRRVLTAVPA